LALSGGETSLNSRIFQRNCSGGDWGWKTTFLWHDNWDGMRKSARYPELWSFASSKDITIHQARVTASHEMFHTPLSVEAFEQFQALHDLLVNLSHNDQRDKWLCNGPLAFFISKGLFSYDGQPVDPPHLHLAVEIKMST
jgi:hypothetical protein